MRREEEEEREKKRNIERKKGKRDRFKTFCKL